MGGVCASYIRTAASSPAWFTRSWICQYSYDLWFQNIILQHGQGIVVAHRSMVLERGDLILVLQLANYLKIAPG